MTWAQKKKKKADRKKREGMAQNQPIDPDLLFPPSIDYTDLGPKQREAFETAIIKQIETRWRNPWVRAREPVVARALVNHAFLNGHQYVRWDGRYVRALPPRYKNQVRLVNNLIRPTARTILHMVTQNKPILDAVPTTEEYVDEATSDVARRLLRHGLRATRATRANLDLWLWKMKGATAFKRVMFNAESGPIDEVVATDKDGFNLFEDMEDGKVRNEEEVREIIDGLIKAADDPDSVDIKMMDERFRPVLIPEYAGELEVQVLPCMKVAADPRNISLETCDKVIIENARTLEWIRKVWPEKGKEVKPEDGALILWGSGSGGGTQVMPGIGVPEVVGYSPRKKEGQIEQAVVRELMIRPCEKNPLTGKPAPLGVHFIWANGVALTPLDNPLPYANTPMTDDHDLDFDLVKYDWFPEPGFWGSDFISDQIPIQRSFNKRRSGINESMNAFLHPKLALAMGSKIKKSAFSDMAGERIEYAGVPPSYLEPPTIRPYVFSSMEMDIRQFNDISMVHEAMREGRAPPQVRTAAGLRFLQERDTSALHATMELYEESESRFGQKLLDRMKQFYEEGRIIEYVGARNTVEVQIFERQPFFSHRWKVFVYPGSSLPDSRAAKIAEANEMLQFAPAMFTDPATGQFNREAYARMIGRADIDDFLSNIDESRQTAETEEMDMDKGVQAAVMRYDDHAAHMQVHQARIRSAEFRKMKPEIQQMKIQHLEEHQSLLADQVQRESQTSALIAAEAQAASAAQVAVATQGAAEAAASAAREKVEEGGTGGIENIGKRLAGLGDEPASGNGKPAAQQPAALIQQLLRGSRQGRS
jgi:hypothetical protein